MKVFKIELMVIDHDEVGADGITSMIEDIKYPNRAISPKVKHVESRDIEWSDSHPLNSRDRANDEYDRLFKEKI